MELARTLRIDVMTLVLALGTWAAGGTGDIAGAARPLAGPAEERIVQCGHRFAVGDIVCRESGALGYSVVRAVDRRAALQAKRALRIVTAVGRDEFAVASLESRTDEAHLRLPGAVLWPDGRADGPGVTLRSDRASFTHCLAESDAEFLVSQPPGGFRPGDVVCLNDGSGFFVRVAAGALKAELIRGTRLFLVTQGQGATFLMSRIQAETTEEKPTRASRSSATQSQPEYVGTGVKATER